MKLGEGTIERDAQMLAPHLMQALRLERLLFSQTATVTVANTVAETTLTGAGQGSLTLPANYFKTGRAVRIKANGSYSYTGTPTILLRLYLGSTNIIGTNTMTTTGTPANASWHYEGILVCRTTGASGSISGASRAEWIYAPATGLLQASGTSNAGVTVDTTTSQVVDLRMIWGTANVANTISCFQLFLEGLN